MSYLWSPDKKFSEWRKLWLRLAEGEQSLGLDIPEEALNEMRAHLTDINYAGKYSKRRRSNVDIIIDRIVFISAFLFYCLL